LNYNNRKKRWRRYRKFEQEARKVFLNRISAGEGFKILKELHQFVYDLKGKPGLERLNMDKIKTLARVHYIFGKVKQ